MYREQIRDQNMSQRRTNQLLDGLDTSKPFGSRLEFIELLAALSTKYKDEVNRKVTGANKEVKRILWSQVQHVPDTFIIVRIQLRICVYQWNGVCLRDYVITCSSDLQLRPNNF